jgi:hypothetical protein
MPTRNNKGIVTIRDVTGIAVAMKRMDKHVSVETNSRNNRRYVFSVRSVPSGYKKDEDRLSQLSFDTSTCQDMSLGAEELRHQTY